MTYTFQNDQTFSTRTTYKNGDGIEVMIVPADCFLEVGKNYRATETECGETDLVDVKILRYGKVFNPGKSILGDPVPGVEDKPVKYAYFHAFYVEFFSDAFSEAAQSDAIQR